MRRKIYFLVTFLFLISVSSPVYGELSAWESEISGDSPLNWYKFNETSGPTAIDYGSAASDGTYGSTVVLNKTTPLGKGVQIVPGVDHTGVIDLSQLVITGDWTLEVVLKVPGVTPGLGELAYCGADRERTEELFERLGWNRIRDRIPKWQS